MAKWQITQMRRLRGKNETKRILIIQFNELI